MRDLVIRKSFSAGSCLQHAVLQTGRPPCAPSLPYTIRAADDALPLQTALRRRGDRRPRSVALTLRRASARTKIADVSRRG